MRLGFKIIGAATLARRMRSAAKPIVDKELARAVSKSTVLVERESRINAPVDTGRLRASHTRRITPTQGIVSPTADYAIYVHQGTSRMRARPFLKQALVDSLPQIKLYFKQAGRNVASNITRGF